MCEGGRREESGAQHRGAPGAPAPSPGTARPPPRPCHPRMRKSRLVMAHRDRETSGMCLKSIKENHYFLEKPPLAVTARRRHPSAANRCLIQTSCAKPSPALSGQQSSSAQGTGPRLCLQGSQEAAVGSGARVTSCFQALIESTKPSGRGWRTERGV